MPKGGKEADMPDYLGIVIKQSLSNPDLIDDLNVIATKVVGTWDFLLVTVAEEHLHDTMVRLQNHMIPIETDCWYNHFFRDDQLIVVFQNKIWTTTTNPESWNDVIQYGFNHGIPLEQLDFHPRTIEDAYAFFGIDK